METILKIQKHRNIILIIALLIIVVAILLKGCIYNDQYEWSNQLVWAIEKQDEVKVKELLQAKNMDVDKPGGVRFPAYLFPENNRTKPLAMACFIGNYTITKMLLEYGADPGIEVLDHDRPLDMVLSTYDSEDKKIVKLLLDHGAYADKKDSLGGTPLLMVASLSPSDNGYGEVYNEAIANDIVGIYKIILKHCKNKQPKDEAGYTVLTNTVIEGNQALIKFIIEEQKLSIDERDTDGRTAIFYLAYIEEGIPWQDAVADQLLSYGADTSIKDNEGKTAYDYSIENGKKELAEKLDPKTAAE